MGSNESQLNPLEQLVIMQTAYDAIGKEISTKGNGLRYEVDSHYRDLYEQTGSKSFDVKLLGDDVGTLSMRFSKPKPETIKQEFKITDYLKLCQHVGSMMDSYEFEVIRKYVERRVDDFAEFYFAETGECLPGSEVITEKIPAEPKQYIGTTLRIDKTKVIDRIDKTKVTDIGERSLLTNITKLLLGAEND